MLNWNLPPDSDFVQSETIGKHVRRVSWPLVDLNRIRVQRRIFKTRSRKTYAVEVKSWPNPEMESAGACDHQTDMGSVETPRHRACPIGIYTSPGGTTK